MYIFMEYISGGSIQSLVHRLVYCVKILEYNNEHDNDMITKICNVSITAHL